MSALCGLCEVIFHIDAGNQVENVWPPGAFADEELADIAFSAFPDSLSMELSYSRSSVRDSCFAFRLARRPQPDGAPPPHPFLYGFAFCRQRQDERLRRGCEQKSVVLLSHLPLWSVLEPLACLVGPTVLSYGPEALREVFEEAQQWPPLEWGCRVDLPLLDVESLRVELPMLTTLPASALPAAVAAAAQQQQQPPPLPQQPQHGRLEGSPADQQGAAPAEQGHHSCSGCGTAAAGAAGAAQPAAGAEGVALHSAAAAATPAQVAAGLADELDGSGLPLCLLPRAYGQQELEASTWGDCDCYTPLRGALQQLWALWELMLLGEPLMVVAPTPGACSATVAALLSLLTPFPYSQDWRPYFTIHDATFARLAGGEVPTASNGLPMLLGITNLYFLKALPQWPNTLSTGYTAATMQPSSSSEHLQDMNGGSGAGSGSGSSGALVGSGGMHMSESAASVASSSMGSSAAGAGGRQAGAPGGGGSWLIGTLRRRPASPAALLSGPVDHCWLSYQPCSRPDKQVLERLVQPQPSDSADKWRRLAAVNSGMLRRHFQELTKALLFPLLPYFTPSLPLVPRQLADPKLVEETPEPPPLQQLDVEALLEQLGGRDAVLPEVLLQRFGGQRNLLRFYERFLHSPNLAAFLQQRRLAAEEWQRQEWAAAAAAAAAPLQEVLSVETFFHLEQQLLQSRLRLATSSGGGGSEHAEAEVALAEQLQQQLQLAFQHLPADLQQAILATPSHAALLRRPQDEQEQQQADQEAGQQQ